MRLLTHNYLQSNVKGTEKGYPLQIEATKVEYDESPCDVEFIRTLVTKIDYESLRSAMTQLSPICVTDLASDLTLPELPESLPPPTDYEESLLQSLHTVLMDIHVVEGHLVCPDTGRRFNISMGIPNMILHEDEI
jgi:multifunctional methyltransferase subunit TRM112